MMDARRMRGWVVAMLLGAFVSGVAFADSSYQESTQLTGGALMDAMKSLSFLSKSMKQAYAPVNTLTMVHGNQKAVVTKESTEITDLDKEEIIHIDNVKKTYSIMTFEQMRQAMQQLPAKIQQATQQAQQQQNPQQPAPNIKTSFNVDVKNTGASKEVNGLMAQEQIVTLTMTVTNLDAQANGTVSPDGQPGPTQPAQPGGQPAPTGPNGQPNSATFVVTNDAWIAPDPPQIKEIADFDQRLAEKMMEGVDAQALLNSMKNSNPQLAQMLAGKPGSSEAMVQMSKEMEKLKGTRVLESVSMGTLVPASAMQNGSGSQNSAQNSPQQNSGSVAGQVATDTAAQTAAGESSRYGGIAGSALGSSIMGAWHHKKANQNTNTNSNTNANTGANSNTNTSSNSSTNAGAAPAPGGASGTNNAAPANGSSQPMQTAVLMSMTSQKSNFSSESVPDSVFAIPAGYTQVAPAMMGPAAPTGAGATVSH